MARSTLHGDIIATDGAIPSNMDAGGTEGNPAEYILGSSGGYDLSFSDTSIYVGEVKSWNSLQIRDGSEFTASGDFIDSYIGYLSSSDHNSITIHGAGSKLNITSSYHRLYVGYDGGDNKLNVENGASLLSLETINIGGGDFSSGNVMTVTGAGSIVDVEEFYVGSSGSNNRLQAVSRR